MKKVVSTVAALALAAAMATSAFAADTGYTKEDLKAMAAANAGTAAAYGVTLDELNASIDALVAPEDVNVAAVKAALETAQKDLATANTQVGMASVIEKAQADLTAAAGASNKVTFTDLSVQLNLDGSAKVSGAMAVNGTVVANAEKTTEASESRKPEWTDSSKKTETATSGTAQSGAAASTAGVIKATGLNTTGAAVAALAVASVLGVAAVKARKLGE